MFFYRHVGPKGPKTAPLADGQRGGQAPALREHQGLGGLSYPELRFRSIEFQIVYHQTEENSNEDFD